MKDDGSMSSVHDIDECAVRWWRGYVKSCFFVVVGSAASADEILTSPLFWSLRKSSLKADGPSAAAHQQLVERLQQQGWQPAGVGAVWYEQRFHREAHEPTAAEAAPPMLEALPRPARPVEQDDRPKRVGTKLEAPAATPRTQGSPKASAPAKPGQPTPRVGKKLTNARDRRGAPKARSPAIPKAARAARVGSVHRARPSRRVRRLVGTLVVVGWAAVAAAEVAALLSLTSS